MESYAGGLGKGCLGFTETIINVQDLFASNRADRVR